MYGGIMCGIRAGEYVAASGGVSGVIGTLQYMSLLSIPFYVVSCYYAFCMYKELKACTIEA